MRVLALMGPRMLGLGVTYLNFVLPTFLGSRLAGGAISAYEYGWRLMQFPETIIGTAVGLTIFPTLAERANSGDLPGLRRAAGWALRLVLALAIPAAAGLLLLGRPLTTLFLQRGAFDADATTRVVGALHFLTLGLIGHSALEVVSRLFYAQRDMWTPFWAALLGLLVNAGLGWLLLTDLQQGAIALGNSVGVCAQVLLLMGIARARLTDVEGSTLGRSLLRTFGATALMTALILGAARWLPNYGLIPDTALQLSLGGVGYLVGAWLLQSEEISELPRLLVRKGDLGL
jgi:putative peptidoglycan lipid II flippase